MYENYLKELYDKQLGQYFTDPVVVNFMLTEIGFDSDGIRDRDFSDISIVDPSCGSGTFLYSAIRELIRARGDETEETSQSVERDVLDNVFRTGYRRIPLIFG